MQQIHFSASEIIFYFIIVRTFPKTKLLASTFALNILCKQQIFMFTIITIIEKYYQYHNSWPTITTMNNYHTILPSHIPYSIGCCKGKALWTACHPLILYSAKSCNFLILSLIKYVVTYHYSAVEILSSYEK